MSLTSAGKRPSLRARPERHWCAYCERRAVSWDHVEPLANGGANHSDNLVACCKACNDLKAMRPLVLFLAIAAHRRIAWGRGMNTGKPYPCPGCGEWVFCSRKQQRPMNLRPPARSPRVPHICDLVS